MCSGEHHHQLDPDSGLRHNFTGIQVLLSVLLLLLD